MAVLQNGDEWEFFKKGNANAVYRYVGEDELYKEKLLRLRLSDQEFNTREVFEFVQDKIRPILPEVIAFELAVVNFKKDSCLNDGYGILLPNLFPFDSNIIKKDKYYQVYKSSGAITLELKPKWLIKNQYGCRNCANHKFKHKVSPSFCSLHLLNKTTVESNLAEVFDNETIRQEFLSYFCSPENILAKIKSLQNEISLELLHSEEHVTDDLKLQMSLRDLTVFLKLENGFIATTITDVDPKSSKKWQKWQKTESLLAQKNLYIDH